MILQNRVKRYFPLLPCFFLAALCAQGGSLITSAPAGGTTTVFASLSTSSCSGSTDAGFAISGGVCLNYGGYFGFGGNGTWNNVTTGFAVIGDNTGSQSFTITLGGLYSAVGGFINYDTPVTSPGPTISAIAADGTTVLDSFVLSVSDPINTPSGNDAGVFVGIQDPTADIAFFELSNSFIAIHSVTLASTTSAVPEPSSFVLLGSALAALLAWRSRLFKIKTTA